MDDGIVVKLLYSNEGGLTVYQFDATERYVITTRTWNVMRLASWKANRYEVEI